jgi:transposase-like protein
MPQKSRFTLEEKVHAVKECMSGRESEQGFAKKFGVHDSTLRGWIRLYEMRGTEGLIPAAKTRKYTSETKRQAVEAYRRGEGSLELVCREYDISGTAILREWIRWYNSHGDFKQPNTGGDIYMAKGRNTTLEERIEIVSYCISNNLDYGKTVEQYGVSYQQVYGWVRKYESEDADGLVDRRGKRKSEAAMTEVEKLQAQLKLQKAENIRLQMENDLLKKLEEIERRRGRD